VFPIQRRELDHVLQKPWCYLIREGEEPICLAPFLFCMDSSRSKRPEVFLSAGITLGPRGGRVRGSGVTTNNTETVPMPSGNTWDLLYAELQRYREEQRRE
jgi:hypothetical protein